MPQIKEPAATPCTKVACYNQRNGRQCWTATHADGQQSYEYASKEDAERASKLDVPPRWNRARFSWC